MNSTLMRYPNIIQSWLDLLHTLNYINITCVTVSRIRKAGIGRTNNTVIGGLKAVYNLQLKSNQADTRVGNFSIDKLPRLPDFPFQYIAYLLGCRISTVAVRWLADLSVFILLPTETAYKSISFLIAEVWNWDFGILDWNIGRESECN